MKEFDPSKPLKQKNHEMFCLEYVKLLNIGKAYAACYDIKTIESARSCGVKLLTRDNVSGRVEFLLKERSKRVEGDGDLVLKMLRAAVSVNLHYWYDLGFQGMSMDKFKEMPEEVQLLITNVKEKITRTGDDFVTSVEVEFIDKKFALDKLGSHEGLWQNNHNIMGETLESIINKLDKDD